MSHIGGARPEQPYTDEFVPVSAVEYKYGAYTQDGVPQVAVHQCNVCSKIFMSYKGLQQHSIIHTDTKPYICEVCGRGFRFKSNMFEHRSVHTGYTPHLCPFCGKQFRLKGNMKKHMRIHVTNKDELEAAYRPYSSNRRSIIVPDNAVVIRGSPVPYFSMAKRRWTAPKLQLGKDPAKWLELICHNQLIPTTPFNEKMLRVTMRLDRSETLSDMRENSKALEFEIFHCPICKCECTGREDCEGHMYAAHGKRPEDMLNEPRYCMKCMRMFSEDSMFLQHQSYHSRVQLMLRNRELDSSTPEVDVSQICYNLISRQHDSRITRSQQKTSEYCYGSLGSQKMVYSSTFCSPNDPGAISLNSSDDLNNNALKKETTQEQP